MNDIKLVKNMTFILDSLYDYLQIVNDFSYLQIFLSLSDSLIKMKNFFLFYITIKKCFIFAIFFNDCFKFQ